MNRILKLWQPAMLAALALTFNACTEEYDYIPETNIDLQGAYILTDETTLILGEDDAQQLQFTVARHDSTEAATYKLYTTNSSINIPAEVSFAANEGTKHFTVDFDFPIGTIEEDVTIGVEENDTYMYGAHSQTYTISRLKLISGCMLYCYGGLFSDDLGNPAPALWDINVFEYGYDENKNGTSVARYLINNPYDGLGLGENAIGHRVIFSLDNKNAATLASGDQTLCYITAMGPDGSLVSANIVVTGNGTYYPAGERISLTGIDVPVDNVILFPWTLSLQNTNLGFGLANHAVIFPEGYDPIHQKQN